MILSFIVQKNKCNFKRKVMRIGITGTQSTGKTTLVKELAKLPEFKDYKIACERSKYLNNKNRHLGSQRRSKKKKTLYRV